MWILLLSLACHLERSPPRVEEGPPQDTASSEDTAAAEPCTLAGLPCEGALEAEALTLLGAREDAALGRSMAWVGEASAPGGPAVALGDPAVDGVWLLDPPALEAAAGSALSIEELGARFLPARESGLLTGTALLRHEGDDGPLLVVSQPKADGELRRAGRLLIIDAGALAAPEPGPLEALGTQVLGDRAYAAAGRSLAPGGDLDGDGVADLLIGADGTRRDDLSGEEDTGGAGATEVEVGSVHLVSGARLTSGAPLSELGPTVLGDQPEGRLGLTPGAAGDLDGDGLDEVVLVNMLHDAGGELAGAAWLLPGPVTADVDLAQPEVLRLQGVAEARLGSAVALMDLDGDGRLDVLLGARTGDGEVDGSGLIYGVPGAVGHGTWAPAGEAGPVEEAATVRLLGSRNNMALGSALVSDLDLDGDGAPDVLAGAQEDRQGGALHAWLTPLEGTRTSAEADLSLVDGRSQADAGAWLQAAPHGERLLVGAPGLDEGRGAVLLLELALSSE